MWLTLQPLLKRSNQFVVVAVSASRADALKAASPNHGVLPWSLAVPVVGATLQIRRAPAAKDYSHEYIPWPFGTP